MTKTDFYTAIDFHIYPLELFILAIGFVFGVIIGSLNHGSSKGRQNDTQPVSLSKRQYSAMRQAPSDRQSPQTLILSYSLSTGQSFEVSGRRHRIFKGHLYDFMPLNFHQNQQNSNNVYEVSQSSITKRQKENQWVKLYNPLARIPRSGKFYFNVFVVKNQYFVKREASEKAISNIAVSRTDIIVGFILAKANPQIKICQEVESICLQAQRDTNGIQGIAGYGFNGKIYSNGDLRIEQKVIKKNKTFTILVNRDQGFLAYEVDGETVGFTVLPHDRPQIVPFVEMFASGSSLIISS